MDVDEALGHLGKFGRWQMFTYSLVCLSVTVSGCWHMMVIVFTGWEPDHHCLVPPRSLVNESIPREIIQGKLRYSNCRRYVNGSENNVTVPCGHEGWYYKPEFKSTIVTEWDLVCDRNYLVETSQSLFAFGVMVGAILFTTLADKIGRKPVHLGCQWAMIALGVGVAMAPNYSTFIILRFFLGAVREGAGLTGIVMACELFPASQRTFAGTALELFWAASWMALAGLAYFVRDWRQLQLCISLPPLATIVLIWILPESIPWLAANGKVEKAEEILRTAAKYSKVSFPFPEKILRRDCDVISHKDDVMSVKKEAPKTDGSATYGGTDNDAVRAQGAVQLNAVEENANFDSDTPVRGLLDQGPGGATRISDSTIGGVGLPATRPKRQRLRRLFSCMCSPQSEEIDTRNNCVDIVRSRKMLLYAFIMCSLWFASGIVYFGLSLSTSILAGDKYLNFFLSGAVEAPAYLMTVFVLQKFGRRWPLCSFHVVAGIVLFANIFIPEETAGGTTLTPVIITLTMIGKFAMTAAFGTVVLYAPEIYPTNLRNTGFGLASVAGRLAAMLAPFSAYIGKRVSWVPGVVFAVVSVSTGLMALLLPETLNRPLPDTIEDIENWTRAAGPAIGLQVKGQEETVLVVRDQFSKPCKDETML